jgi:hypothetical protein
MVKKAVFWVLAAALAFAAGNDSPAAPLTFTPRVSVTEEYNDNIDLDRKDKMDDFITTVSPGATVEWLGQTAGLRVSYDPAYSVYADHDEFNSWSHRSEASIWNDFTRSTRLELSNFFLYTQDPLAQDTVTENNDIIVQGNNRSRNQDTYFNDNAIARLSHAFGPEDTTYAQFGYGIFKYDDPDQDDGQFFRPAAGVVYWFSQWTGMELHADYTRGIYDENTSSDFNNYQGRLRLNQRMTRQFGLYGQYQQIYRKWDDPSDTPTAGGDIQQDYYVYAPSAGVFYQFDPTLTASLGIGWFYQQIDNGNDQSGPFLSANINKLWDYQRWSIQLRSSSGIDSQDFADDQQGFERFVQSELIGRYNFTREFWGDLGLRFRYSDFINSEDDEKDYRYTVDAGLSYQVLRWMTLRLGYAFNKLDAVNSTDDYEQNRVYATITLQPDLPWKLWD